MIGNEKAALLDQTAKVGNYNALMQSPLAPVTTLCCHGNSPPQLCCQKKTNEGTTPPTTTLTITRAEGDHCHGALETSGYGKVDKTARRRLLAASVLCLLFMIGEIVGGLLANSLAIATDAAHLLTDFASFMISLFALWLGSRPATRRMSFGWYRAEVIGALTSVLLIWVVTGVLVYMAVQRIVDKSYEIEASIMLITAAIGVIVNIIMGVALQVGGVPHGHSHGPSAGHSHGHGGVSAAKGKGNINVRAAFIHVVGDFIQSLGVLVAAFIIYFKPEYSIADPICTFFFSVLVLITTFAIVKETLNVLMEGLPRGMDFMEVQRVLSSIPGVVRSHNLRIWALSMDKIALSAHVAIAAGENPSVILKRTSEELRNRFGIFELTLQVEEFIEDMRDCTHCQDPSC